MGNVQEILARSRALLAKNPPPKKKVVKKTKKTKTTTVGKSTPYIPSPVQKYIKNKYFSVLAPEGFEWHPIIVNWYPSDWGSQTVGYIEGAYWHDLGGSQIIHGHEPGVGCALPYKCHIYGWLPPDDMPEVFKLDFYAKFKYE